MSDNNLKSALVDLVTDIWRLEKAAQGIELPPGVLLAIDRLKEDLLVNNVLVIDPSGERYDKSLNYEVMHIDSGDGDLWVSETASPGVSISGTLMTRPKVYLAPQKVV